MKIKAVIEKLINLLLIQTVVDFLLVVIFELFQVNNIELKWYTLGVINGFLQVVFFII